MADILLEDYPPVAGDTVTASVFNLWNYDPTSVLNSFNVINGSLDALNVALSNDLIQWTYVREQTFSHWAIAAGTANLDYFKAWYTDVTPVVVPPDDLDYQHRFIPIAGGAVEFYMPWEGKALILWEIDWSNDNGSTDEEHSILRLFVDGEPEESHRRVCKQTRWGVGLIYYGAYKGRYWHGAFWPAGVYQAGYHTVSLRLLSDDETDQTRIRCRSIKVIPLRVV